MEKFIASGIMLIWGIVLVTVFDKPIMGQIWLVGFILLVWMPSS